MTAIGHKVSVWVGEEVQQLDYSDGCLTIPNATKFYLFTWRNVKFYGTGILPQ